MNTSKIKRNIHPESMAFMEISHKTGIFAQTEFTSDSIVILRNSLDLLAKASMKETEYDGKREERFVPSEDVKGGIPVYVYTPRKLLSDATILIYFHGGGNIAGTREMVDGICKILSSQAECIVVNVEYRLAPEHKFPAMFDDAVTVARWVLANRTSLGGTEKSKVGISGDSAGGLLAVSVSHDVPGLAFQIPVYAVVAGRTRDSPSYKEFDETPLAHPGFMTWIESLVAEKEEDLDNPRYWILGHKKYDNLPPTLLIVAELDELREENYEYLRRLKAAGVESELFLAKGAVHGYYVCPAVFPELCRESHAKAVAFIKKFKA